MRARTYLLIILLGATTTLALYLNQSGVEKAAQVAAFKHSFYLQDFTLTRFDSDGQLKHILKGQQIDQDAVTGESQITKPEATLFKNNNVSWRVTAETGWMDKNQNQAKLENDVVLQQVVQPQTKATTSKLTLNLSEKTAENSVPTKITQAKNQLQGTGLLAKLDQNWLKLKAEVRGAYAP